MKPKVVDLFAGCGGFSHGFQQAGCDVIGFVEQWPPAVTTFLKNHPHALHLGNDITQLQDETLQELQGSVDIIVGGPPCQGFSYCGKRDSKDERNQLYKHYLRCVKIIEPKIAVMENVAGILTLRDKDGKRFIDKILTDFIDLGYSVTYKVLNAADYGVAQNRARVILIAKRLDLFPQPEKKKKTVIDAIWDVPLNINGCLYFKPYKETVQKIKNLKQGERICNKFNFSRQRLYADRASKTIATKPIYIHPHKDRLLTPRELARLQSFPDEFYFTGTKTNMVKQIGNAVPPLLAFALAKKIKEDLHHE